MIGEMMKRMRKTTGTTDTTFKDLFEKQMQNQMLMLSKGMYGGKSRLEILPIDDVKLVSYHILQLMSELGEVLDADKRWKNFRNDKYDKDAKAEEIADCFIVLMNVAMFSGIDADELSRALIEKIKVVNKRIEKE